MKTIKVEKKNIKDKMWEVVLKEVVKIMNSEDMNRYIDISIKNDTIKVNIEVLFHIK